MSSLRLLPIGESVALQQEGVKRQIALYLRLLLPSVLLRLRMAACLLKSAAEGAIWNSRCARNVSAPRHKGTGSIGHATKKKLKSKTRCFSLIKGEDAGRCKSSAGELLYNASLDTFTLRYFSIPFLREVQFSIE